MTPAFRAQLLECGEDCAICEDVYRRGAWRIVEQEIEQAKTREERIDAIVMGLRVLHRCREILLVKYEDWSLLDVLHHTTAWEDWLSGQIIETSGLEARQLLRPWLKWMPNW